MSTIEFDTIIVKESFFSKIWKKGTFIRAKIRERLKEIFCKILMSSNRGILNMNELKNERLFYKIPIFSLHSDPKHYEK